MWLSGWEYLRFPKTDMLLLWAGWATCMAELGGGSISGVLAGFSVQKTWKDKDTREPLLSLFPLLQGKCEDLEEIAHTEEPLLCKSENGHPLPHLTCTSWLQGEIPSYWDSGVSVECSTHILEGVFLYMYYCIVFNCKIIYSFTILQHRDSALPPVSTFY